MKLIVIESPNKIKTIQDILKKISKDNYKIIATYGHILDLDPNNLSIDKNYEPIYKICKDKEKIVNLIKTEYSNCDELLISTDCDREGEMIGYSIEYILQIKNTPRLIYNAITENDIKNALLNPKSIDINILNSQKTRRITDRLIGYKLSPVFQQMINGYKISIGRVQSVIVKLICEKENEIKHFIDNELKSNFYINGYLENDKLNLYYKNNIFEDEKLPDELLLNLYNSKFTVSNIDYKERIQNSPDCYTTSSLQQDCFNKFHWTAKYTMTVAQHLYEKGHITYMRTDSTKLSETAIKEIKQYINKEYMNLLNTESKKYKKVNIQGAHEAIRPTKLNNMNITDLDANCNKLYTLIFKRTIASLMKPAIFNSQIITISSDIKNYNFIGKAETIKELGYLILYKSEVEENKLFNYKINTEVNIKNLECIEKYNKIPCRYNESSLINKLDPKNLNICRPSTYATFIEKIQSKNYVVKQDLCGVTKQITKLYIKDGEIIEELENIIIGNELNKFVPTTLGIKITNEMEKYFPQIMDYNFTSNMEKQLDEIEENKVDYKKLIIDFDNIIETQIKNIVYEKTDDIVKEFNDIKICQSNKGLIIKKDKKIISIPEKYDKNITLEQVNELLKYPKEIGKYERKKVVLHEGKFGFYIKYNKENIKLQNKYSPDTFTLDNFKELLNDYKKEIIWEYIDNDVRYIIKNGQFGLYINVKNIKSKKKSFNKKLPKNFDCNSINIEHIKEIINKKTRKFRKKQ